MSVVIKTYDGWGVPLFVALHAHRLTELFQITIGRNGLNVILYFFLLIR